MFNPSEERGHVMLVLRSLKQILPAQTLGFWDGEIAVAAKKKSKLIISTYESSLESKTSAWQKILRVRTLTAICEAYVQSVRMARPPPPPPTL